VLRSSTRFSLIAGLLIANLLVGVVSLYFIRSVNRRYAELFEQGTPVIYNLRMLTREITGVQRLARRLTSPAQETSGTELAPQMVAACGLVEAHVRDIGQMAIFRDSPHPAALADLSREYSVHAREFLQLVNAGNLAEADRFNLVTLRPCHDRFQGVVDASADYVEQQARDLRTRYAKDSRFFGGVSLAFASVPVLAVTGGALVMTVLIGVLFVVIFLPASDRRR
jgi:hypothetical protein